MWSTVVNDDAARRRDGAKMNRVVNSTLRYVSGQGRCAFPVQNPSHRPRRPAHGGQAKVSNFLHRGVKMTDEKEKLLAAAISQIEKDHGKGAIMRLGSRDILVPVSVIPSGCLSIDAAQFFFLICH